MDNYKFESSGSELLSYNLLWGVCNVFIIWLGSVRAVRMLLGYGVTFLLIQLYTIFFQYLAAALGPLLSTFFAGFITLFLAMYLENYRKNVRENIRHP